MKRDKLLTEMTYYLERLHSKYGDLLYTYEGTCDMILEHLEELDVLKEYDE
jgi:hypothetical protein